MTHNLFEEINEKKQQLVAMITKAAEFGWIPVDQQRGMLTKLEQDKLTIGVIGQMKCGKSTFLNAFVFEEDVLPAATTPMTAALSVITYGSEKKIVAEFYTQDEWEEQKLQASRSLEEVQGNAMEESKVKAAKELVEKSSKLGNRLQQYLGKTQEDSFDRLIEYVGADGKYIAITKAVTIYYPKEYLKGVEIVDTPGFNDPIVSREERTKAFLKKADVVVMMLYAGRPFDATDRSILFQNVRQCGIGKVIVGINKYDIPYENGETEEEIKEYVKTEIKKACKACADETLVEILKGTEPIPLSAEMALLSKLSMSKISTQEVYQFAWKRACENFEISSQAQMREKSHIEDLASAIKSLVENEKGKILFAKPINAIMAAGAQRKENVDKELRECKSLIEGLQQPDDELDDKEEKLNRANERLKKKISALGDGIDSALKEIIRKGEKELEGDVEAACDKMDKVIDGWGKFSSVDDITPQLDKIKHKLLTNTLRYHVESLGDSAKQKIQSSVTDFFCNTEGILMRYMDDEFDSQAFIKGINDKINLCINDKSMFTFNKSAENNYGWDDVIFDVLNVYTLGVLGRINNALGHDDTVKELKDKINLIQFNFDPRPFLNTIFERKEEIINMVKQALITELLNPMQAQIQEIRDKKGDKEKKLREAQGRLCDIKKRKQEIEVQIQTIQALKLA